MYSWKTLFSYLEKSRLIKNIETQIRSGESLLLEGLWDAPKSAIAALALECGRSVILITDGVREDRLFEHLEQLVPGRLLELPAWDTLPEDPIEPTPDLVGKRFEALHALIRSQEPVILLCPLQSFLQPVLPKEALAPLLHHWKRGKKLLFQTVPELLTKLGYKRVPLVQDKGEFAVRGGIIDLFPLSSSEPYRIEWEGDLIAGIRTFDIVSQKSVAKEESLFLVPGRERGGSVPITSYFLEEPIFFWDDLLSIEDRAVALKKKWTAPMQQHIFCSDKPIEELSPTATVEIFERSFPSKRVVTPFQQIDLTRLSLYKTCLAVCPTEAEEKQLQKEVQGKWTFERGYVSAGFGLSDGSLAVVSYGDIAPTHRLRRQKWRSAHTSAISPFQALAPGDRVVHFHSGIGKFIGKETQSNHLGVTTEFLVLEYAEGSKLFVPVSQAHLISRYVGAHEEVPHLSQLGGKRWQQVRQSAQAEIVGYAKDLLKLYAERSVSGGFRTPPDSDLMIQFERDFPYTETPDQLSAIAAIKEDMMSDRPMDRLICGDVGYGKTEVAMRAAFKAVVDGGKQVAVLVPTTVLALQHYETFAERMRPFPIKVDHLSRFRTPKQQKETIAKVEKGVVDIVIGTHRLLSKDLHFKNLGLIVVDEEQRFGVKAKEHLKHFKTGIDCLTLSATPIPRTLYMSIVHVRDMSPIHTPPQDRLPVKTVIAEGDFDLIKNAIERELARGGQVFYIHNRVETIPIRAEQIHKLVPNARFSIVHGQMDSDEIDTIFHQFKSGSVDILFATTIVENGVDIPNANTILIDRADTYGLADLYQLRGRVGRWNRTAYAYFLIPKQTSLPEVAKKRLSALAEAGGYGGGMKVAMRDLEIRGAGNLLGVEQSGQVSAIGFHLYCKLLKQAVSALKQKRPISFLETKLEFSYDARLPDAYISDFNLRLELYSRFGEATALTELEELLKELKDRFGAPPSPVLWLYHLSRIRIAAQAARLTLVKFAPPRLFIEKESFPLPHIDSPQALEAYAILKFKQLIT